MKMIRDRERSSRLHLCGCRSGELWVDEEWESQRGAGLERYRCLKSVGGCGSGLVLNGQECWRGTGVVCVCVCGGGVGVGGRRSGVKVGKDR